MRALTFSILLGASVALAGCSSGSKFRTYNGPEVTQLFISKESRRMYLLHGEEVLKTYNVDLGFEPEGDKKAKGDGRTPEGFYLIDRRNPNSAFHLSIGISYPNRRDVAESKALGVNPGGDIFIHGQPNRLKAKGDDWTAGCIAVSNDEIEEIYSMVQTGTPIYISP